jgi:hypothetical protein
MVGGPAGTRRHEHVTAALFSHCGHLAGELQEISRVLPVGSEHIPKTNFLLLITNNGTMDLHNFRKYLYYLNEA